MPKNAFFVHFGKAAGSYVNVYIFRKIFLDEDFLTKYIPAYYNNWWSRSDLKDESYKKYLFTANEERRDFFKEELKDISALKDERVKFCQCHHNNVDSEIINFFKKNDWYTFTFLRNPKDLICSLYFFSKKTFKKSGYSALGPLGSLSGNQLLKLDFVEPDQDHPSLDTFINRLLDNKVYHIFWALPEYLKELDFVKEFNDKNFSSLTDKLYGHWHDKIPKKNTTCNLGYEFYLKNGYISEETNRKLVNHEEYLKYSEYINLI